MTEAEIEAVVRRSEGLVKETASQMLEAGLPMEFEDVAQLLRIKVWKAAQRFDQRRADEGEFFHQAIDRYGRTPIERFIFGCVLNMRKDIEKKPRHYLSSIDELRDLQVKHGLDAGQRDRFDARYLSTDHEQVFGEVEDDLPLPSSLTKLERQVVELRLEGLMLFEIDRALSLSRAQRERVMRSIREKLADWKPESPPAPRSAPMRPLPGADPQRSRARAAQAV